MKTTKSIVILLSLVLLTAGPARSMERATEISDTYTASCLVRISSDPAFLPLDFESLDALLHSSGVGGRAVRDVLGISPDEVHDLIQLESVQHIDSATLQPRPSSRRTLPSEAGMDEYQDEMMMEMERRKSSAPASPAPKVKPKPSSSYSRRSSSSGTRYGYSSRSTRTPSSAASRTAPARSPSFPAEKAILIRLDVYLDEDVMKPAAEEFLDAVIDNLKSSLLNAFDDYRHRLNDHLEVADKEAARTENDLREKQDMLREISGSRILNRNYILQDISNLREQMQSFEMEMAFDQVTINATTKRIAEIEQKLQARIANDAVTRELHGILEIQVQESSTTGRAGGMRKAPKRGRYVALSSSCSWSF